MGCAASRAWFTKAVGSLTDAKPVLAWGTAFLLIGAFCAIMDEHQSHEIAPRPDILNLSCGRGNWCCRRWTGHAFLAKVRNPYFSQNTMLAKITSKNQLTLPKSVTQAVGATEYFDVEARAGQIILTPVRIQRSDAVRAKLAELNLTEADIADAVAWARAPQAAPAIAAEPVASYAVASAKVKKTAAKKPKSKA
jgi:hypothetical protein